MNPARPSPLALADQGLKAWRTFLVHLRGQQEGLTSQSVARACFECGHLLCKLEHGLPKEWLAEASAQELGALIGAGLIFMGLQAEGKSDLLLALSEVPPVWCEGEPDHESN